MVSIRKGGHRDLERYYPAMEMDFDSEELLPKLAIHKAMMAGEQELRSFTTTSSSLSWAMRWCA